MNLRKEILPIGIALFLISSLSSCEFITGVFKGGVYVGVLMVVVVIVLVIWLLMKLVGRK